LTSPCDNVNIIPLKTDTKDYTVTKYLGCGGAVGAIDTDNKSGV